MINPITAFVELAKSFGGSLTGKQKFGILSILGIIGVTAICAQDDKPLRTELSEEEQIVIDDHDEEEE